MPSPPAIASSGWLTSASSARKKLFASTEKHTLLVSISRLGGIPSYACPLNTVPVKEGLIGVFVQCAVARISFYSFPWPRYRLQCCLLRTEFRSIQHIFCMSLKLLCRTGPSKVLTLVLIRLRRRPCPAYVCMPIQSTF